MNNYRIIYNDYLSHHGILGQKWGVRRFQNKDGSLTSIGKKRIHSNSNKKESSKEDEEFRSELKNIVTKLSNKYGIDVAKEAAPAGIIRDAVNKKDLKKVEAILDLSSKMIIAEKNDDWDSVDIFRDELERLIGKRL